MQPRIFLTLSALCVPTLAAVSTYPVSTYPVSWTPPGLGDVRGPCPFLNALANHGFLPHDGKNIDQNLLSKGVNEGVGLSLDLGAFLFRFAVTTNPTPNATDFSLNDLTRHGILEHDASLSRLDTHFGPADVLNQANFDVARSYWSDVIDLQQGANAVLARYNESKSTNPEFSMSELGSDFTIGETAAYIIVLGDQDTLTVKKSLVEYLFQNERLPYELGWKVSEKPITQELLINTLLKVRDLVGPLNTTCDSCKASAQKRIPTPLTARSASMVGRAGYGRH